MCSSSRLPPLNFRRLGQGIVATTRILLLLMAGAILNATLAAIAHAQITARTPATTAGQSGPVAPTYVAAGNVASGVGAVTPALPAGIAANDILLLFVETSNQAATITNQNGGTWAAVASSPQGTGTAVTASGTRLTVFWSRYNGSQGNPTLGDPGDHQLARIVAARGVTTNGNPWDVTAGAVEANNTDTSGSIPGATTSIANTFVVTAIATALPDATGTTVFSGWANANFTVAEQTDNSTNSGDGGGLGIATGVMATAGAYPATSVTTSANTAKAMMSIALRPDVISQVTVNKPTGTVLNDVMVGSVALRLNSPGVDPRDISISAPSGWTLASNGRVEQLNSTGSALAVYTKVAGAAEPASYTWSFSCVNTSGSDTCVSLGFNGAAGGIVSFSGVDTATPVDVDGGAPTGSATTAIATPSITTTMANTMLVSSHAVANAGTWAASPPSGMTQAYQVASATVKIQVSTALQAGAGTSGTKTATDSGPDAADYGTAHILALRPLPPTFNQSAYRVFSNTDSTDVGTAVAGLNAAATLNSGVTAFRLRMLIHVDNSGIATSGQAFKLQFAARSGTCDTGFAGESYADVTASSVIAYNNNATPADGANLTANASDPTHGGDTVVNQTYEELNNFTNSAAIAVGRDGLWDFSLVDNGGPVSTAYCFRVVKDTGAVLDTYTVIPEITTARGTVFYFHDATTPDVGTLPGTSTTSAVTPNVTAATAGTNRDMDQVISLTAPVNIALTTLAQTGLQRNWFRRFVSRPLEAQTLPTGAWTIQGAAFENNAASNMLVWGAVLKVWRPSTGTVVATLLDNPQLGATEPGTAATVVTTSTGSIAGVAVNDGDVLMLEIWAENTQGNATARTNTVRYDGTTEGNAASPASYLQAPGIVAFHRGYYQSAFRLFNNADSTNVGTALATQDTSAILGAAGATFRARALIHVADMDLGASGQAFKLQFAAKGIGTCAAPSGGTPAAYTDVTAASLIAFNNNPTPADGANLTANANDPTHGAHTVVNQTYEELNNFINSAAISAGQDGKWDFALKDNGAPAGTTYCIRVVKDTGAVLDAYFSFPEITTATGPPPPGSFNVFETSTAALAITGVIKTRVAGSTFSLDVVAISGGAQQAGFTDDVLVELLGNNTLGVSLDAQNCPTSSTPLLASAISLHITGGRSTVNFPAVANSWRDVRVRVKWPTATPTVTSCSTDNFAIRPDSLASFAVTDNDWQTAGAGRTLNDVIFTAPPGGKVHKAGRPLSVNATAVNSAATTTSNYVGAPSAVLSACVGAACTSTFGVLTLTTTFAAGQLTSNLATYDNVGSFALRLEDSTFASVDSGDTNADCTASGRYVCSATISVGRFVPDHFAVAVNSPAFGPACSAFTYVGQAFTYATAPLITVTARNFADTDTTFYDDNTKWWRLTNSSLTGKTYTALPNTLNTSAAPGTDPVIAVAGSGSGSLTFGSGTGFFFTRTTPVSPFNAEIGLSINVIDADGVSASNPIQFGAASAGNGIAFSGSNNAMRFGRLTIGSSSGSPNLPLTVPVEAQYWNGQAFVTNILDSCTPISASALGSDVAMTFTGAITPAPNCKTAVGNGGTLSTGRRSLRLSAPTGNASGNATLTVNLGTAASGTTCTTAGIAPPNATTANRPYLQGGSGFNQNPSSRATFGVYRGSEDQIHRQENF